MKNKIKNLYTPYYFKHWLSIEKRRTERLGCKSSIIIFNLEKYLNNNDNISDINIEYLIKNICAEIRETDAVCFKDFMILILLPDTDKMGALCAAERLIRKVISAYFKNYELNYDNLKFEILSYPEKQTETKLPKVLATNDTLIDTLKIMNNISFKEDYIENLNLSVCTYNGSSLALRFIDAFFWDQQLILKILPPIKKIIKRVIDIIGSIIGLILFSPIMLLTVFIIKVTSPGPILFKQKRIGYRGKYFTFLKFRSMYNNCNEHIHQDYVKKLIQGKNGEINKGSKESPFYKIKNDHRVTPIGRLIRKTNIDELPQLWNVLKGEMSLVGPRPAIPYEVKEYQNWHYRRILEVKPGITGLWQVLGRNKTTFDEMVRLDIQYAENWTLLLDFKILLKTIKVVFTFDGA